MISFKNEIHNMTQVNASTKQAHRQREQACGCQGGGKDWEFGVSRYKLVYMKWISGKVLLDSTGNYIPYPVTNHNGKI